MWSNAQAMCVATVATRRRPVSRRPLLLSLRPPLCSRMPDKSHGQQRLIPGLDAASFHAELPVILTEQSLPCFSSVKQLSPCLVPRRPSAETPPALTEQSPVPSDPMKQLSTQP